MKSFIGDPSELYGGGIFFADALPPPPGLSLSPDEPLER